MIKKSFGIALIAASVLVMGCSSDDDDATPVATTDAGATEAGATEAGATEAGATEAGATEAGATEAGATEAGATEGGATEGGATEGGATEGGLVIDPVTGLTPGGYTPGQLTAIVEENGGLSALEALKVEGLDRAIDGAVNTWTVLIPSNDAIAAATGPVDVQNHIIVTGAFNSSDVTGLSGNPSSINANSGLALTVTGGGADPLLINGIPVITADLMEDGGTTIVHIIGGVL